MSQGYNGWSNYETWLVSMWFGDVFADFDPQDVSAESFRDYVEEMLEADGMLPETGFAADIMNAALRSVDWREIAEHYAPEEEEDDEDISPDGLTNE